MSRSDQSLIARKRRYGELTGLSKQIAERASGDTEMFERVKSVLLTQLAAMREDEGCPMKDTSWFMMNTPDDEDGWLPR